MNVSGGAQGRLSLRARVAQKWYERWSSRLVMQSSSATVLINFSELLGCLPMQTEVGRRGLRNAHR